jgi:hypothetical protein
VEDVVRIDEFVVGSGGTASEFCVVHARDALENEEIGDCVSEGVRNSLDDVNADVVRNSAFDSGDGGA